MHFKNIRKFFTEWKNIYKNDPIKKCDLYKNIGCSHVDGYLCDFPNCTMNKEYLVEKELFDLENELDIPHQYRFYNKIK
jgi:hypothetical protein